MKKGIIIIGVITFLIITVLTSTELSTSLWFSITGRGYILPDESSIFTFKVTKMNEGSGEWWLYAEDKNYFYTMEKHDTDKPYTKISKEKAKKIMTFDKYDYRSWQIQPIHNK